MARSSPPEIIWTITKIWRPRPVPSCHVKLLIKAVGHNFLKIRRELQAHNLTSFLQRPPSSWCGVRELHQRLDFPKGGRGIYCELQAHNLTNFLQCPASSWWGTGWPVHQTPQADTAENRTDVYELCGRKVYVFFNKTKCIKTICF